MSMCSALPSAGENRRGSYSTVTRNCEIWRVLSGQWRSAAVSASSVLLIGEARHVVVGLRLQPGAQDAAFAQATRRTGSRPPFEQGVDERGDEHGLAGARQAGDAEPHGGVHEAGGEIRKPARGDARAVNDVGKRNDLSEPLSKPNKWCGSARNARESVRRGRAGG